jgi:hypothetical protein
MQFSSKKKYILYRKNLLGKFIEKHIQNIIQNNIVENKKIHNRNIKKLHNYLEHRIPIILLKNRLMAHLYYKKNNINNPDLLYFQDISNVLKKITKYYHIFKIHNYTIEANKYVNIGNKYFNETYINKLITDPNKEKYVNINDINKIILSYLDVEYCYTQLEFKAFIPKEFYKKLYEYRITNNNLALGYIRLRVSLLAYKFNKLGSSYNHPYIIGYLDEMEYFNKLSDPKYMDFNV